MRYGGNVQMLLFDISTRPLFLVVQMDPTVVVGSIKPLFPLAFASALGSLCTAYIVKHEFLDLQYIKVR